MEEVKIWRRAGAIIQEPIGEYLDNLLKEEKAKGRLLQVAIGTDSQRQGKGFKFSTVILVIVKEDIGGGVLKGHGGKIMHSDVFRTFKVKRKEGVNERMLAEVGRSIEVAYALSEVLEYHGIKLTIHADINPDPRWESNSALKEAIGYILGMGYDFKIKPDAWAASYGGDRYANNKK